MLWLAVEQRLQLVHDWTVIVFLPDTGLRTLYCAIWLGLQLFATTMSRIFLSMTEGVLNSKAAWVTAATSAISC